MAIYKNTPPIVTNGLSIHIDPANRQSYTSGSSTIRNLSTTYTGSITIISPTSQSFDGYSLTVVSGSSVGAIQYPGNDPFFNRQEATVELWVKPPTAVQNVDSPTLYFGGGTSNSLIALYRNTTTATDTYTWLMYATGSAGLFPYVTSFQYTPYQWYQTVLSYSSTGTVSVYINGVLRNTQTFTNFTQWSLTTGNNVGFGASLSGRQNGSISTMRYYTRALSQAEITQNYNATKTRFGLT